MKEENSLIRDRMSAFGTLQGFLWAAFGLSLNRSGSRIWLFILLLSIIGFVVSVSAYFNMWSARKAIYAPKTGWDNYVTELEEKYQFYILVLTLSVFAEKAQPVQFPVCSFSHGSPHLLLLYCWVQAPFNLITARQQVVEVPPTVDKVSA